LVSRDVARVAATLVNHAGKIKPRDAAASALRNRRRRAWQAGPRDAVPRRLHPVRFPE
jgi:hypothetical protein